MLKGRCVRHIFFQAVAWKESYFQTKKSGSIILSGRRIAEHATNNDAPHCFCNCSAYKYAGVTLDGTSLQRSLRVRTQTHMIRNRHMLLETYKSSSLLCKIAGSQS